MMKNKRYKNTIIRLCILILVIFLTSTASLDSATVINPDVPGVTGTKHNLSIYGPGSVVATSTTEICVFCHTPHFAQPTGPSGFFLSCHDGTIAIGSLLNAPGAVLAQTLNMQGVEPGTGALISTSAANVETDLRNDHQISFSYSSSYPANSEIKDPGINDANIAPAVLDK